MRYFEIHRATRDCSLIREMPNISVYIYLYALRIEAHPWLEDMFHHDFCRSSIGTSWLQKLHLHRVRCLLRYWPPCTLQGCYKVLGRSFWFTSLIKSNSFIQYHGLYILAAKSDILNITGGKPVDEFWDKYNNITDRVFCKYMFFFYFL